MTRYLTEQETRNKLRAIRADRISRMMRHHNLAIRANCSTLVVREALMRNKEQHAKIVAEARIGYLNKATEALTDRLEQIADGKIVALHFDLVPPADYTEEYDTAIQMLRLHQDPEIELSFTEVRMFIEDKWDWSDGFFATNAVYSDSARVGSSRRG